MQIKKTFDTLPERMTVIILRGLPGAGKSYFVSALASAVKRRVQIVSADQYHMDNGEYKYLPQNAGNAHLSCLSDFSEMVGQLGEGFIVVDNTNTTRAEMAPYIQIAKMWGHKVKIVHVRCTVEESISRNVHNVPPSTIANMYARWENPLPYWPKEFTLHSDSHYQDELEAAVEFITLT